MADFKHATYFLENCVTEEFGAQKYPIKKIVFRKFSSFAKKDSRNCNFDARPQIYPFQVHIALSHEKNESCHRQK